MIFNNHKCKRCAGSATKEGTEDNQQGYEWADYNSTIT